MPEQDSLQLLAFELPLPGNQAGGSGRNGKRTGKRQVVVSRFG